MSTAAFAVGAAQRGQDTRAVLLGAGYTDEDIDVLRARWAIHCGDEAARIEPRRPTVTQ